MAEPLEKISTVESPPKGAVFILFICVAGSFALPHVPYGDILWRPLMLLSTLVHELGHGVAGILVGGKFISFEMFPDGSGFARIRFTGGRLASAAVSAGGLVGPAIGAAFMFFLGRTALRARITLGVLAALLILALALIVRNWFGASYVIALTLILITIVWKGPGWLARFTLIFLAVQLALSVFSRSDYLFTETVETKMGDMPSDVGNMEYALFLPYWFWGAVCGLISITVLLIGLRAYLRPKE